MNWDLAFLALFDRSLVLYRSGDENLDHYYTPEDSTFLTSIGCQPREFFDFVEDFADSQAPDPNGSNLSGVWDAAPSGQIFLPTKTQGGAGACPGLWDVAPLGLKLVSFDSDPLTAPSTALLVAAVRRDYFLTIQRGQFSDGPRLTRPGAPPFEDALDGFVYLPRLLAKARAKLRGELDPDLMYGCGADRRFFRQHGIHPADFLRHVWAAGEVDAKVVDWLRFSSCPNPS